MIYRETGSADWKESRLSQVRWEPGRDFYDLISDRIVQLTNYLPNSE